MQYQNHYTFNGLQDIAQDDDIAEYHTMPENRPKFVYIIVYEVKAGQFVYIIDCQTLTLLLPLIHQLSSHKASLPKNHCDPSIS